MQRYLRPVFIGLAIVDAVVLYGMVREVARLYRPEWALIAALCLLGALNIWACFHAARGVARSPLSAGPLRLLPLWFKAKETELKRRSESR